MQHAKRAGAPGGLAAKLGSNAGEAGAAGTADYPHLLEKIITTVLADDWAEALGELQKDQFGSPLLQAVLRAAACLGNECVGSHSDVLAIFWAFLDRVRVVLRAASSLSTSFRSTDPRSAGAQLA